MGSSAFPDGRLFLVSLRRRLLDILPHVLHPRAFAKTWADVLLSSCDANRPRSQTSGFQGKVPVVGVQGIPRLPHVVPLQVLLIPYVSENISRFV